MRADGIATGEDERVIDALARTGTGRGIRVGVVDSGWDRNRLDSRALPGVHVTTLGLVDTDDHDRIGHGTTCARIILEMAPDCVIILIRIFEERLETSPKTLIAAIDWAVSADLKVLNLSLGTMRSDVVRPLYAACSRARNAGVILVAAARSARDESSYPAVFEPVIGVGLTDLPRPDLVQFRPGGAIECATSATERPTIGNEVVRAVPGFGVSYAAPIVTALVARWLEENPSLDVDGVRELMRTT